MTARVDCGECPRTEGCPAGRCMRLAVPQRQPATGYIPGPATIYALSRASDNDRRALDLQRQHQDVADYRAR